MHPSALALSLEAIDFQSGMLFKELTLALNKIRQEDPADYEKALANSKLSEIIKRHTNVGTQMNYADVPYINAWVMPPMLDKNHPLLNEWRKGDFASIEGLAMVRSAKDKAITGTVDLKNCRVGGIFAIMVSEVTFTRGIFEGDQFTDEELAAILLHELGHVFTYFEYLGFGIRTNYILSGLHKALTDTTDKKLKYEIIEEASKALDIDIEDPEALIRSNKSEVVQTVILRKVIEKRRSELGSSTYDNTAWEQSCDQFAARHGAGRALTTGLAKMNRYFGNSSYMGTITHCMMEAAKIFMVFGSVLVLGTGISLLAIMLIVDPMLDEYDRTERRLLRIRQESVAALKEPNLTNEQRKSILGDIEAMDAITSEFKDKRTWVQLLHTSLYPGRRKQYQQQLFQNELEELAFNDLFIAANKFKSLIV